MSKGRMHYTIEVNEDGQVIIRPEEAIKTNPDVEVIFEPIIMTRAQSAWLADEINEAQGRAVGAAK